MNVSVIVATYGDAEWEARGNHAAELLEAHDAAQMVRYHDDAANLAQARNVAASRATEDWLCFVDADDELAPGYFDAMESSFAAWDVHHYRGNMESGGNAYPNVLLVPSVQYVSAPSSDHATGYETAPKIPDWDADLFTLNCAVIGTLIPRAMFNRAGWFRQLAIYEDWELWLRCVRAGARMLPVRDAVYRAHTRSGSRNNQDPAIATETYQAIRAMHSAESPLTWANAKL